MPVDAVVVVNHASHELLARHLTATVAGADLLVVVVDNSSRPQDTAAAATLCAARGWFHVPVRNEGFGAGVNAGLHEATARGAQGALVLNPDLAITSAAALELLATARERDALVAPRVDRPDGRPWFTSGTLDERTGSTRAVGDATRVEWLSGACLAATTATWARLGGFDPRYFLYWEDVDLGRRATRAGVTLLVRDDVTAVHDVGGTQSSAGSRRKSDTYYRENCRGRLVFAAHHLDARPRARWILGAPAYARAVVLRGGRRQLLHDPRPVLAAISGTLAGAWYARRTRPAWPPAGPMLPVPDADAAGAA
jgi:N-acetylglucosaminyl-diphospho-decaprenol L-rhamnosyltransferase